MTAATTSGRSRRTAGQHQLTWGPFDDREPIWSHDGTRIAFSSDRGNPLGSDYNIWVLDARTGELRQLTKEPAEDYMPTWSPDDRGDCLRVDARERPVGVGRERRRPAAAQGGHRDRPRRRAVVGTRRPGRLPRHRRRPEPVRDGRQARSPAAKTCSRSARRGRRRPICSTSRTARSDAHARRRGGAQTVDFTATLQVTRPNTRGAYATSRARSRARRSASSGRCCHPTAADRVRRCRRHLRRARRRQAGEPHQRRGARHRPGVVAGRRAASCTRRTRTARMLQLWIRDMQSGRSRQVTQPDDAAAGRHVFAGRQEDRRSSTSTACGASRRCRCSTSPAARSPPSTTRSRSRGRRRGRPTARGSRSPASRR